MTFNEYSDQGLYFVKFQHYVKIGISSQMTKRFSEIQVCLPEKIEVLATFPHFAYYEKELHERFTHLRTRGEWFYLTPEIFQAIEELKTEHDSIDWPEPKPIHRIALEFKIPQPTYRVKTQAEMEYLRKRLHGEQD